MIALSKIDFSNILFYSQFALNNLFELMINSDGNSIAFGADYGSVPCGAVVAKKSENNPAVWVLKSLFVTENFRRKGVATALLNKVIHELAPTDCTTIEFKYITSQEKMDEFSLFLVSVGFSLPKKLTTVFRFNKDALIKNSRMVKLALKGTFETPGNVKIVPMDKIDSALLEKLKSKNHISYPENLSPFKNEHGLKEHASFFAINDSNEIVGWLTGFMAPSDSVLYRSFFVVPEYRRTSIGFFMFNEAVKYIATDPLSENLLFAVAYDNTYFERFASLFFKGTDYESKKYEFISCLILKE